MKTLLTIHLNCIHQTLRWSDPNPLKMYTSKTYTHLNNNTLRADDNRTELGARDGVTANCQLRAEGERLWTTMLYQLREVWGGGCEGAVGRWTADQHCTQSASDNNSLSIELVTTDSLLSGTDQGRLTANNLFISVFNKAKPNPKPFTRR